MSAACLETSDPAIPMATPMSAFFERWRIIDSITSDSHNGAHPLTTLDNNQLLLRRCSCKYNLCVVPQDVVYLFLSKVLQLSSIDNSSMSLSGVYFLHRYVHPL